MPEWGVLIIIGGVIFWTTVITIVILSFVIQNKNINESVEQEIENKLNKLNYNNYNWKSNQNYNNLKNELRDWITDNRKTFPSFSRAYKNNSPTKNKEILNIVKEYLELDNEYSIQS